MEPMRRESHFETVYNECYVKIYGICRRYSAKPDDAEDMAHDVFVQYFRNFERFRNESSPLTWMYRVAINLGISRWRKDRFREPGDMESEPDPVDTQDHETRLLDRIALGKILDRCPERTRRILILLHFERLTQVEVGKALGISRATVTRNLVHFRRFCRPYRSLRRPQPGASVPAGRHRDP